MADLKPVGRIASGSSFVEVNLKVNEGETLHFGEPVYIEREKGKWGYIGRIVDGTLRHYNENGSGPEQQEVRIELLEEVHFDGDKAKFKSPSTIPLSDLETYRLSKELVSQTYGFDKTFPLYLGHEEMTMVEVRLRAEALIRHVCILGRPGTGKSYTTGVFMEECVNNGVPVVLIDITGESQKATQELGGKILTPGEGFTVRLPHLSSLELLEFIPNLGEVERNIAADTFEKMQQEQGDEWTIYDYSMALDKSGEKMRMIVEADRAKRHLNHSIREKGFIGPGVNWIDLFNENSLINIYMGDLPTRFAVLAVAAICRSLMSLRLKKQCPPFVFILDEAHRFVPNGKEVISSEVVSNFLRIGRHLHVGTVLVSQSPSNVSRELLILSNTRFIHALDGTDLKAISGLLGDAPEEMLNRLPTLPVGTALVCGTHELIRHTYTMKVRERKSTHGAPTVNLVDEAKAWKEKNSPKKVPTHPLNSRDPNADTSTSYRRA